MNPALLILGYRTLRSEAVCSAELLNLCMEHHITFTGFCGGEDGSIRFSCTLRTAARVLRLAKERGISVKIVESGGLPQALWERRRRAGLLIGSVCAIFLMIISGQFVWDVRVTGNETMTAAEVREELAACGFGVGSRLHGFHAGEVENRVLLRSEKLAWISVYIDGTVAKVQVVERRAAPENAPVRPANLVATADGQIESVELYRGNCLVKIGQPVRAGELLVSGVYNGENTGIRFTRAAGKVMARTEHTFHVEIPLSYAGKSYTGTEKKDIRLNFFQKSMKIFKNTGNVQGGCDIIEKVNSLTGFGLRDLPVFLTVRTYRYYEEVPAVRTPEEALELAYARLSEELGALSSDTQLIRKEIGTVLTENSLILDCTVLCIENIAVQSEFEIAE